MRNNTIEVHGVAKNFDRKQVLTDVSFEFETGEIVGIIGENGAGKTTLFRCLCGLLEPSAGEIRIFGQDYAHSRENILMDIGAIIEAPSFYDDLSGTNNLKISCLQRNHPEWLELAVKLAQNMGLEEALDQRVKTYSLGMKQKLALCRMLSGSPRLLVLDEPINGLDVTAVLQFRDTLRQIVNEYGCAALISSHILHEIEAVADRVLLLKDGKLTRIDNLRKDGESLEDVYKELIGGSL